MSASHIAGGYFIIPRIYFEGKLWQNKDAHRLYIYYLKRARFAHEPVELVGWTVNRGELLTSLQQISDDTSWVKNKQKKSFSRDRILLLNKFLTNNSFITTTSNSSGTKITVCNYCELQSPETYTSNTSTAATSNTGTTHNNKVNKNNNKNISPNYEKFGHNSSEILLEGSLKTIRNDTGKQSVDKPPVISDKPHQLPTKDSLSRQETVSSNKTTPSATSTSRGKKFSEESNEIKLSKLLFEYILKRDDRAKVPDFQKWAYHVDLLRSKYNRSIEEIEEMIHWCQQHDFWKSNILSTEKLKIQFDQLIQKKLGDNKNGKSRKGFKRFEPQETGDSIGFDHSC